MIKNIDDVTKSERFDVIIDGATRCIDEIRELFTRYHATHAMTLKDVELLSEIKTFISQTDGFCIALFMGIKHGGNQQVVKKLRDAIERFDTYFDKLDDEGYDFEKFDFVVITDQLILSELKKLTDYQMRRIPKIEDTYKWLVDNMSMIDLANHESLDFDDVMDVEKEYKFKFDNIFDNIEEIQRKTSVFMRLRKLHEHAEHISMCAFFDYVHLLKNRIERYSDERSPAEYVRAKYQEAIEKGEMILSDEYELLDWEMDGLSELYAQKIKEEADSTETKTESVELQTASTSNSALFNKEFFSMAHIEHLHKTCNGRQFEEISPGDMYLIVNLQHCPRSMKVREREQSRVCHLIYFLGEMLPDVHRRNWRKTMLDHLGIPYSTYNKKYKEAEKGLPSRNDEIFIERLEALKDTYRDLERVA